MQRLGSQGAHSAREVELVGTNGRRVTWKSGKRSASSFRSGRRPLTPIPFTIFSGCFLTLQSLRYGGCPASAPTSCLCPAWARSQSTAAYPIGPVVSGVTGGNRVIWSFADEIRVPPISIIFNCPGPWVDGVKARAAGRCPPLGRLIEGAWQHGPGLSGAGGRRGRCRIRPRDFLARGPGGSRSRRAAGACPACSRRGLHIVAPPV